ncbi:unnamed protein product [Menidia menidia]|uniref:(Atlantic silverside) hypothetical protein n=1 Tax=Menidia menidia TaxID=238744 RepID=A0A8S4AQB9_9TELE|nr:unnamed protein product [Menidia menidia]
MPVKTGIRQTFGSTGTEKQYLNTVIPYEKRATPPSVDDLQMLTNILYAMKEDSDKVPTLLTDYILKGTGANIQMPDSSMEVIKGQMVVLRASYLSDLIGDLNANIIVWNFFSNGTQLVRSTGANIQMPDSSMEVIKGQMVVLRASYLSDLIGDLNANIIVWNFFSNGTQLGRVGFLSKMPSTDVSLYVNNTRESDSGRYVCQVIYADKPGVEEDQPHPRGLLLPHGQ